MIASSSFARPVLIYFLRKTASLTFTNIKSDPRTPQTLPITRAAGMSRTLFSVSSSFPNFSVDWSVSENGDPSSSDVRIESVNVLNALARKTLQSIPNVQKVLGLEISYENKVPPIGAPNAALTPADMPLDII